MALSKKDFDFKTNFVRIDKAITYDGNAPKLKDTKTGSKRDIPLPDEFVPIAKKYTSSCEEYLFSRDERFLTKDAWKYLFKA